jgi:uncharacterized protein with von Willebrand factor type A (vWA) domain
MGNPEQYRFEITDKSLDFLGYKALRDLLGLARQEQPRPPRHARDGHRHRSQRRLEAYEFGDTMNLDASGTILNAVLRDARREADRIGPDSTSILGLGPRDGIAVDYEDLMVAQGSTRARARRC